MPQESLPAVYMRGGTSKGLFIHEHDLPPAGPQRDALLLEVMGTPDPMQIDGMGGSVLSTSKVMIVTPNSDGDADVDYVRAQVAVTTPTIEYRGNCGNLTAAVAAFAVDEGLVTSPAEGVAEVMLRNRSTGTMVRARVPVAGGRASVQGDHVIAGVPTPGARIENCYLDPAGGVLGSLFPTGQRVDTLQTAEDNIEASLVDAGALVAFVRAEDVGIGAAELPSHIHGRPGLLDRLERIRVAAAVRLGLLEPTADPAGLSPGLPMLAVVGRPTTYTTSDGDVIDGGSYEVRASALTAHRVHHAYPVTVLMCTAAATHLPGTVVHGLAHPGGGDVRIGHPSGVSTSGVRVAGDGDDVQIHSISVTRTARRLMAGQVYYRSR